MPRVGCGRADITPEPGLPMVGMPGSPRGEGVQWPLRSRVFLVDDGERRVAVVCLDLIALVSQHVAELRERLAVPGEIDPENILVACSHTHRAPFTETGWGAAEETTRSYLDLVFAATTQAMVEAVARLQPAQLSVGKVLAKGTPGDWGHSWAFNRRPIYAGGQVGTHGPAWGNGFVGMEGSADEELAVLLARGPDGRVLGGLVDFACHPTAMGHEPVYSADYPGVLTEELEERHGGIFGFLIGAAGDTSTPDPTSRDPESGFGRDHTQAMGRALAGKADEAIQAGRPLTVDRIGVASAQLRIPQRRPTMEQVELARWYLEERPADLNELDFTRRLYGHDYTFNDGKQLGNERHAQELLAMWQWQQGASDDELVEAIEIQVVTLGDMAIVAFPVELFSDLGRRVKTESPFPDTLIATLANGWHGYAPTLEAFNRGGYEPRFAYPSRLAPEAGDRMADAALELLRRLSSAGPGSRHGTMAPTPARDSS
jgi:neutral ceramidase